MPEMVAVFLIFTAISGFYDLIMNGIPLKIGGITNDGYNIFSISKNRTVRHSFYVQLRVNGLLYKGVRMKDMNVQWFELPSEADLNNSLISSIKCLEANYYHDRKEFVKLM